MKTIDEILDEYAVNEGFESYLNYCDSLTLSDGQWIEICRVYAKQVAEQALKDAAENATCSDASWNAMPKYTVDTESILETEIKLP